MIKKIFYIFENCFSSSLIVSENFNIYFLMYHYVTMNYSFLFKKILICFMLFSAPLLWRGALLKCQNSNVGIGTVTPAASALLELSATDRGFLTPRIADTNLIASPATGLLIYLTTNNKFYYFNGTFWQALVGGLGTNGYTGATGLIGVTGNIGTTGTAGDIGVTGSTGSIGITGSIGLTGTTGSFGTTGTTGQIGVTGSTGDLGVTGSIGATGTTGDMGATGSTGLLGITGSTGSIGFTGATGTVGATGSMGITGSTGPGTICGSAAVNYLTKFTSSTDMCKSIVYDDGTNVGIGTTSPLSKLHLVSSSPVLLTLERSTNLNSVIEYKNSNVGSMFAGLSQANNFAIGITDNLGSSSAVVTVTPAGFVGIGTITPTRALDVNGVMWLSGSGNSSNEADILFDNAGSIAASQSHLYFTSDGDANGSGDHIFKVGLESTSSSTELMRIKNNGYVGIGTSSPASLLHLSSSDITAYSASSSTWQQAIIPTLKIQNSANNNSANSQIVLSSRSSSERAVRLVHVASGSGSQLGIITGAAGAEAERMRIDYNGNVGIGTSAPDQLLELSGGGIQLNGTYGIGFNSDSVDNSNASSDRAKMYYDYHLFGSNLDGLVIEKTDANNLAPDGGIAFANKGSDNVRNIAMSIRGSGNIGIGTLSPSEKLEVCGNLKVIGTINASSTINASQSISCSSDVRFKKNITPLPNALTSVMKLQGVNYYWKTTEFPEKQFANTKQVGFIAQDLEKIYPEMVITDKEGYKSVDYSRLTPVLVEAMKEQQKIIEEQQQMIKRLNLKVDNTELKFQTSELKIQKLEAAIEQLMKPIVQQEAKK
jgi:hypothetical protein